MSLTLETGKFLINYDASVSISVTWPTRYSHTQEFKDKMNRQQVILVVASVAYYSVTRLESNGNDSLVTSEKIFFDIIYAMPCA